MTIAGNDATAVEPGAMPVDPHLQPEWAHAALVVIDVQNDFLDTGSNPVPGTSAILPDLSRLLGAFRETRRPIVHVIRLYAGTDIDRCRRTAISEGAQIVRPRTRGSRIPDLLLPAGAEPLQPDLLLSGAAHSLAANEIVLWKPRWSAFYRTRLDEHLQRLGVTTVVVAGANFPNCPRATIYDASARDFRVVLVSDASSAIDAHNLIEIRGIGVVTLPVGAILECLNAPA